MHQKRTYFGDNLRGFGVFLKNFQYILLATADKKKIMVVDFKQKRNNQSLDKIFRTLNWLNHSLIKAKLNVKMYDKKRLLFKL